EQLPVARNEINHSFERQLYRLQIIKDIRVIEFEVVDDRNFRTAIDELAALIKKGGVILVAFDDEPFAVGEPRALTQVRGNAADQKTGIVAVVFKHPRK